MKNRFTPLFITQFLGVLNDNLLKSLICFLAITWNCGAEYESVVSIAASLLIIPYLLLSPLAGRLSTIFSKQKVVQWSKFAEIPIMIIACLGFYFESLNLSYVSIFLMGAQSAIYSPSKYGMIKELKNGKDLSYGTGLMEMLSFIGILLGTTIAGFIAEIDSGLITIIMTTTIGLAVFGWLSSLKIARLTPQNSGEKINVNPISFFIRSSQTVAKTKGLFGVIFGIGFFWFIASLMQLNLFLFCSETLKMDSSDTGLVIALLSVGIGGGCFFAGKLLGDRVEPGLSVWAMLIMTVLFSIVGFVELSQASYLVVFMLIAFMSGLYKVPLNAWLQQRVSDNKRGNVLAYLNMVVFLFVLLTTVVFYLISHHYGTIAVFKFSFVACFICLIVSFLKIPVYTFRFLFLLISKMIFRVKVKGQENVPIVGGGLMIANHVSYLDSFLFVAAAPRNMRFVMYEPLYRHWALHWLMKRLNVIPISVDNSPEKLKEFTKKCQDEINKGHILCIFPEGKLNRGTELNEFKKGVEFIANGLKFPVIPLHLKGLEKTPLAWNRLKRKFNGFWPNRLNRKVEIVVGQPINEKLTSSEYRQKVIELG